MASPYGHLAESGASNDSGKKKKFVMIGASAVILVAMVVAVSVGVSKHNSDGSGSDDNKSLTTTSKSIESICQPTDYREECVVSLSAAAGNTTDPKKLIEAAFTVAIEQLGHALQNSSVIQEAAKDPRTEKAVEDCKELLGYAVNDLKHSFDNLGGLDITKVDDIVDDLKVWLSAAVTYQETCLDGFENTTGDAAESMRKALNSSAALTSNALAIMDEISSVLGSFELPFLTRRLLSEEEGQAGDELPAWVAAGKRRLLALSTEEIKADVVVAQDGSGKFKTINEALDVVPTNSDKNFVIHIKEGIYKENVQINRSMTNVVMIGDGPTKTTITGNLNFIDGTPTFKTATVAVVGDGFIAKDLGIENSAGAEKHQAVALRVQSDKSVFYNCQMDGYQDTLYTHTKRQFYRECTISGTIDFVFGNAPVVFQNCVFLVRKPLANQQNIVTAQGRKTAHEPTGIVLQNCTITSDPAYYPVRTTIPSYLGRPWKPYSRTIIMQTQIDDLINPEGWLPWMGDYGLRTCFYAEIDNRGPGAATAQRVTWPGVKKLSYSKAQTFTVESFLQGNTWLQTTGAPYIAGMLPLTEGAGGGN